VIDPEGELRVTLRPATEVEGDVAARAFVMGGGAARPWPAPIQARPHGAFSARAPARDALPAGEGPWEIVFAVGRPDALPPDGTLAERVRRGDTPASGEGLRIVRVPLRGAAP
jgi:hypothetical protein